MNQICTSIKQSQKLLKLGLNPETADMYWRDWKRMTKDISIPHVGVASKDDLPAWSLTALLHQLPFPELWQEMIAGMIVWKCKITYFEDDVTYTSQIKDTEIEAALDCVLWVLENKNKNYV